MDITQIYSQYITGQNGIDFQPNTDPVQLFNEIAAFLARIADATDPPMGWQKINIANPIGGQSSLDGVTLRPGEAIQRIKVDNPFNWIFSNIHPIGNGDSLNIWLEQTAVSGFVNGVSVPIGGNVLLDPDVILGDALTNCARPVPLKAWQTISIEADAGNKDNISGVIILARK